MQTALSEWRMETGVEIVYIRQIRRYKMLTGNTVSFKVLKCNLSKCSCNDSFITIIVLQMIANEINIE